MDLTNKRYRLFENRVVLTATCARHSNPLAYTSDPSSENVREAADDAAARCDYDQLKEVLLDYEIVGIRRVSVQSVKHQYPDWL